MDSAHEPSIAPVLRFANIAANRLADRKPSAALSVDRLLDDARRVTSLDDFGCPEFLEPLSRLVSSLENEARLTALGRSIAHLRLRVHLVNRLRLQADRKRVRAIAQERIVRPLFVVGPPRTGTSILFRLLAQDESALSPLAWQIQSPSPPPPASCRRLDGRHLRARADEIFLRLALPRLSAIRDTRADLPEECCVLQAQAFVSILFAIAFDVPSYQSFLSKCDYTESYAWHHAFLQQLQCGAGRAGSWVLKSPGHLLSLQSLFDRYPDACIVQTHRDPLEVVPSLSSLSRVLRSLTAEAGSSQALGESVASFWSDSLDRALAFRRANPGLADRFLDVRYQDIAEDPLEVARQIHAAFDRRLTPGSLARMRRFLDANPRGRHGLHSYSLEEFGLDPESEARRFERYRAAFPFDDRREEGQ